NIEIPLTVFLRHSRDPLRLQAKAAWCRSAGIGMIAEPSRLADPAARAAILAQAMAEKRVLVITPDLAQRRGSGIPVKIFGREVYMPSGVASLALLTAAPIIPVRPRPLRNACRIVGDPAVPPPGVRRR